VTISKRPLEFSSPGPLNLGAGGENANYESGEGLQASMTAELTKRNFPDQVLSPKTLESPPHTSAQGTKNRKALS
jgi:hypothetical protein